MAAGKGFSESPGFAQFVIAAASELCGLSLAGQNPNHRLEQ
jgi:hypothetical protein